MSGSTGLYSLRAHEKKIRLENNLTGSSLSIECIFILMRWKIHNVSTFSCLQQSILKAQVGHACIDNLDINISVI